MGQKTHTLKILPEYFAAVLSGDKKAEFRFNDRKFSVGDLLVLQEWSGGPSIPYTGREIEVLVTHVLELNHLIAPGFLDARSFVMLSIVLPVGYKDESGKMTPMFQDGAQ
ncbi:DUF3850 domain-containing protein [Erwinia sp. AnSW2-5]|uniref:DUF3850 domain-containing protein n=1 Tax=Erwinia sp. AnSW2-5 TaxID=3367692 RepID=UPI00385DF454